VRPPRARKYYIVVIEITITATTIIIIVIKSNSKLKKQVTAMIINVSMNYYSCTASHANR